MSEGYNSEAEKQYREYKKFVEKHRRRIHPVRKAEAYRRRIYHI